MNNNDYRDYFDKIKCSPEFKAKMEELLSAVDNVEYADSVSDVEHMPKINVHRWTAIAASVVLVLGLGGGVICMMHGDQPVQPQVSVSKAPSEKVAPKNDIVPDFSKMGIAELEFSGISGDESVTVLDFGKLPQIANDAVLENLSRGNWTEQESFDIADEFVSLTLSWHDDHEMEYTVYGSGNAVLSQDGENYYFSIGNYYSLVGIISHYLPYCSWENLVSGDNGIRMAEIFKENLDSIGEISNYQYTSDHGICFLQSAVYSAYINKNGIVAVEYATNNGMNGTTYFLTSEEMYKELAELMNIPVAETSMQNSVIVNENISSDSEKVYTEAEKEIKNAKNVTFTTGNGQVENNCTFESVDLELLLTAVKSLKWSVKKEGYIKGDQFIIGDIIISKQGEIYFSKSGILYSADGQDLSMLNDALTNITESSDIENIAYMLSSSKNNFFTVSAYLYRSFNYNGVNILGSGLAYWDKTNSNEYIVIENGDNSYEFIMESGYWTFIQRTNGYGGSDENSDVSASETSVSHTNGFRFYDTPSIDFECTISDLRNILNQVMEFPDKVKSMDITRSSNGAYVDLVYNGDTGMSTHLVFSLDNNGMPTYMSKSVFGADSALISSEEFALSDCVYDGGDFAIPELTDEQKSYIEEAKS